MLRNKAISIAGTMVLSFALAFAILAWQRGVFALAAPSASATERRSPLAPSPAASPLAPRGAPIAFVPRPADPPPAPPSSSASAPTIQEAAASPPPVSQPQRLPEIERIARTAPLRDNFGTLTGIRVFPGHDPEQFYASGLKGGDLVVAINGTPIDDSAASKSLWNQLSTGSTVTVQRRGKRQDVILNTAP
jgi:hypothetical protein